MSVKEQLTNRTWATTSDYKEAKEYVNKEGYEVSNTYYMDGLFCSYYISIL